MDLNELFADPATREVLRTRAKALEPVMNVEP